MLLTADAVPVSYAGTASLHHRVGWYNATFALDIAGANSEVKTRQIGALAVDGHVDYANYLLSKYGLPHFDLTSLTPRQSPFRRVAKILMR